MTIAMTTTAIPGIARLFFKRFFARSANPRSRAAGISDMLPLGRNRSWGFTAVGRVPSKDDSPDSYDAYIRICPPGYLSAMECICAMAAT